MKPHVILGGTGLNLLLAGCVGLTQPASPSEAHGLTLTARSSAAVQVFGPRLQINKGKLELAGSIAKKPQASTTAFSHLDILFCADDGRILQTTPLRFFPRSVGQSRFGSRLGYYRLTLDHLPPGTGRIEVQAHAGDIAASHG